jgi:hypothetical protein
VHALGIIELAVLIIVVIIFGRRRKPPAHPLPSGDSGLLRRIRLLQSWSYSRKWSLLAISSRFLPDEQKTHWKCENDQGKSCHITSLEEFSVYQPHNQSTEAPEQTGFQFATKEAPDNAQAQENTNNNQKASEGWRFWHVRIKFTLVLSHKVRQGTLRSHKIIATVAT